jgi:hypothetical protein
MLAFRGVASALSFPPNSQKPSKPLKKIITLLLQFCRRRPFYLIKAPIWQVMALLILQVGLDLIVAEVPRSGVLET